MKILVTGGAGYIGASVISELVQKGHTVKVYDKLYFGSNYLKDYQSRIEIVQGDIRKFDKEILNNVSAVIHLAGFSNDPTAEFNPKANMEMNREGTKALAEACIEKGIKKLTYASSASIYDKGLRASDEVQDEETPVEPIAAYSTSKYEGEKVLLALAKEHPEFCPVILRQGTVYGYSPRMRYDLVINTFVKKAFTDGKLSVFCGGTQWRPLVDVRDVARAHVACLEAPEEVVRGQIFNVCSGNYQVLELAHRVKSALKGIVDVNVEVDYEPGRIDRSYRLSGKKLERVLDFKYLVSVEESARNMALKIKKHLDSGGKLADLDHPIHYNITWMTHLADMEKKLKDMGGSVF